MLRTPASLSGYPTSTWAGLPAAASAQGQIVRVTDIGVAGVGILVISDGTRWSPLGPQLLARSGVAASVTGTTNETTLATVTVPGGLLGINGGLIFDTAWSCTNSANTKTPRVRFGGIAGDLYLAVGISSVNAMRNQQRMRNRGTAGSQVGASASNNGGGAGTSSIAVPTGAKDSTVSQDIVMTGQLALGTETMALEAYDIWVTP